MRPNLIFAFFLISVACSDNNTQTDEPESTISDEHFQNFPEKVFLDLKLSMDTEEAVSSLITAGYIEEENGSGRYKGPKGEEVIIPDSPRLNQFKVFLFDQADLENKEMIKDLFLTNSYSSSSSESFSYYQIKTDVNFKITVFDQPEFIRLTFQIESKH